MGLYRDQVLPRVIEALCGMKAAEPQRRRVCDGLAGEVVEIGFGSGLNVPFYPSAVTRVAAIEPADVGWKLARKRLDASDRAGRALGPRRAVAAVRRRHVRRRAVDLDDVHDPRPRRGAARAAPRPEAGRRLHFVEHGLAPDEKVQRWQHRLEPIQKRLFGGCHLTRPIVDLLTDAGFTIAEVDVFYEEGSPKVVGANSLGVAVSPARRGTPRRSLAIRAPSASAASFAHCTSGCTRCMNAVWRTRSRCRP